MIRPILLAFYKTHEDIGGCVNTNGKNVSLNEMFDGMVYTG